MDEDVCTGPMFWYLVPEGGAVEHARAIVHCCAPNCDYVVISPAQVEPRHQKARTFQSPDDLNRGGQPMTDPWRPTAP